MVGRHRGRRDHHFGPEGLEQAHLLLGHLVGHREDAAVTLERGGDRETHAGVARGALDDGAAGPSSPAFSAASMMPIAIRSLTEPPGLAYSAFP